MDAVWIKTIRVLEMELARYRRMRKDCAAERDPGSRESAKVELAAMKTGLNLRYSQIIAFTAGMSDAHISFDCDLEQAAVIIANRSDREYVFGPSAIASTTPHLSPELQEFVDSHKKTEVNGSSSDGNQNPVRHKSVHSLPDLSLLDYLERHERARQHMLPQVYGNQDVWNSLGADEAVHLFREGSVKSVAAESWLSERLLLRQQDTIETGCDTTEPEYEYLT